MAVKMFNGQDAQFLAACSKANVKATKRQYKKYQKKEGSAYLAHKELQKELQEQSVS